MGNGGYTVIRGCAWIGLNPFSDMGNVYTILVAAEAPASDKVTKSSQLGGLRAVPCRVVRVEDPFDVRVHRRVAGVAGVRPVNDLPHRPLSRAVDADLKS